MESNSKTIQNNNRQISKIKKTALMASSETS